MIAIPSDPTVGTASDGGDNSVRVGDQLEGFAVSVVVVEETVDGGLKVDDGIGKCRASVALIP